MYRHLLAIALICMISKGACTDPNYRLNTPIVPSEYQILITPYFATGDENEFTFDGTVSIQFTTTANTNQIKLHSEDLIYTSEDVVVVDYNTGSIIALNTSNALEFNKIYTFAYINLQSNLETGVQYVLQIKYKGPIRTDLSGFYRNYYLEKGVKK